MISKERDEFQPKPLWRQFMLAMFLCLALAAFVIASTFQASIASEAALVAFAVGICLYGLAALIRNRQVLRNRNAMRSRAITVVMERPRVFMVLMFAGTLALMPEFVLWINAAWRVSDGPELVIAASAVLFCALVIALSALGNAIAKGAAITFDERGIQYPSEWPSTLHWTAIKDIRLVPAGRLIANLAIDLYTPTKLVTKRRALFLPGATRSEDGMSINLPQGILYAPITEIAAVWRQRMQEYGRHKTE